jgi:hypothetical protein
MLIHISVEELEEEFKTPWRAEKLQHPHIDYATNAIHAWFGEKDCIIFKFKDFGFINTNVGNSYKISSGSAGITIQLNRTN